MTNKFVDLVGGNDANDGSTFALRKKTLSSAAAVAAAGDVIRVMGNASTNSGTATWTNNSPAVTLSAAINQLLYADGLWTAVGTNVTQSTVTSSPSPKEGTNAVKFVCAAGFTTGKIAHLQTALLNLSAYRQACFWIQSTTALAAGALSLVLCSDTGGATAVNTLTLNVALNANQWTAVTIDNGAALGASINSIKLVANSSMASKTIIVDNIFTAKAPSAADCLTLNTMISPDNLTWYSVQSVNGTAVKIDGQMATAAGAAKGFQGATGSTPFYMLQPTQVAIGTGNTVYAQVFSGNGAAGTPITISGGWNSTDMSTQTGWTTIDRMDWAASGVNLTGTTGYVAVDHFNFAHTAFPLGLVANSKGYAASNGSCAGTGSFSAMPTHGVSLNAFNFLNASGTTAMVNIPVTANYAADGVAWSVTNSKIWGCTVGGIKVPGSIGSPGITISGNDCSGNGGIGFDIQSLCGAFFNNTATRNAAPGFNFQGINGATAHNLVARNNTTGEVQVNNATVEIFTLDTNSVGGSAVPQIFFPSGSEGQASVSSWTQYTGVSPAAVFTSLGDPVSRETAGNVVSSHREGANVANNSIYTDFGVVTTTGVVGQSGTGAGWKLSPTQDAYATSPLRLNVAKVPCPAGITTTVKFWAKLSASPGISAQFRVFGGRCPGVGAPGSDITAAVSGTAWAQYSLTFTPTENCVVDVFFEAWSGAGQSATMSGPVTITQ